MPHVGNDCRPYPLRLPTTLGVALGAVLGSCEWRLILGVARLHAGDHPPRVADDGYYFFAGDGPSHGIARHSPAH